MKNKKNKKDSWSDAERELYLRRMGGYTFMLVAIIIATAWAWGEQLGSTPMNPTVQFIFMWVAALVGAGLLFSPTVAQRKIRTIIDTYSHDIEKHSLKKRVKKLSEDYFKPKKFKIALLEMLVHYGENGLKKELDELKGVVEPEPQPEPEPEETEEEQEWKKEAGASAKAGFARKFGSKEAILKEWKRQQKKVRLRFANDDAMTTEELEEKLNRLEETKNELIEELRIKGMMNE